MVLLKEGDFELRPVETTMGFSYPLITGVCIWYKNNYVGIVEPENDVIAKFTFCPDLTEVQAFLNWNVLNRMIRVATDIVQSILSIY